MGELVTQPHYVTNEEFAERLIAWARSLTPAEKAAVRAELYAHFGLPPEPRDARN